MWDQALFTTINYIDIDKSANVLNLMTTIYLQHEFKYLHLLAPQVRIKIYNLSMSLKHVLIDTISYSP